MRGVKMLKRIKKISDSYVYKKGYKKGIEDSKKREEETKENYEQMIKNIKYSHGTELMERSLDNKILKDQIKKVQKQQKENDKLSLELYRKEKALDKFAMNMREELNEFNMKGLKSFQRMSELLDEIERRRDKQIEYK